jgi:hypothetical protein
MLASIPFLLIMSLSAFSQQRNLHGWYLICFLAALMIFYLSFGLMAIFHDELLEQNFSCEAFRAVAYFSMFSWIFWLNVMCYEAFFTSECVLNILMKPTW